ncbi:MAG: hypothetical protein M3Y13_14860 [Armatimonadota bacterium]|nr:hypothetical protein [Armatimonadota bacterium]
MERKLHQEPQFDLETLRGKCDAWKAHGASQVVIEWSTGTGPTVFYYPAGERLQGVKWTAAVETYNYNEVYADFIEHKLIPQMREVIHVCGLSETVLSVDLQPLQIQRQRRRQIERAQTVTAGHH